MRSVPWVIVKDQTGVSGGTAGVVRGWGCSGHVPAWVLQGWGGAGPDVRLPPRGEVCMGTHISAVSLTRDCKRGVGDPTWWVNPQWGQVHGGVEMCASAVQASLHAVYHQRGGLRLYSMRGFTKETRMCLCLGRGDAGACVWGGGAVRGVGTGKAEGAARGCHLQPAVWTPPQLQVPCFDLVFIHVHGVCVTLWCG